VNQLKLSFFSAVFVYSTSPALAGSHKSLYIVLGKTTIAAAAAAAAAVQTFQGTTRKLYKGLQIYVYTQHTQVCYEYACVFVRCC